MKSIVYRVEHRESGIGPFRHNNDLVKLITSCYNENEYCETPLHPIPTDDIGESNFTKGVSMFAVAEIEQLQHWFAHVIPELIEAGFIIAVYETQRVKHGKSGTQLCFPKNDAKRIATLVLY